VRYDYLCEEGHVTEQVRGREDSTSSCPCGASAQRVVLEAPYAITETGGAGMRRHNHTKTGGKYRVSDFQEASETIDDTYSRREKNGEKVERPDLYKQGIANAKRMGAKIRS
jgi:hypothetical protein